MDALTGRRVAIEALKLVHAPHRERGFDLRTGVDCVSLVVVALARPTWLVEVDVTAVIPE